MQTRTWTYHPFYLRRMSQVLHEINEAKAYGRPHVTMQLMTALQHICTNSQALHVWSWTFNPSIQKCILKRIKKRMFHHRLLRFENYHVVSQQMLQVLSLQNLNAWQLTKFWCLDTVSYVLAPKERDCKSGSPSHCLGSISAPDHTHWETEMVLPRWSMSHWGFSQVNRFRKFCLIAPRHAKLLWHLLTWRSGWCNDSNRKTLEVWFSFVFESY